MATTIVARVRTLHAQDDLATLRERICPECGAPESEIAERGHREVGRRACCHACTCLPEHFDLEEHETER
jgi:hypothetical protein